MWESEYALDLTRVSVCVSVLLESPVQSQSTDGSPALVQAAAGLLQGVALRLSPTSSIFVPQQNIAQTQHRRYALCVLLDISLQFLDGHKDRREDRHRSSSKLFDDLLNISPEMHRVKMASPKIKQRTDMNY